VINNLEARNVILLHELYELRVQIRSGWVFVITFLPLSV